MDYVEIIQFFFYYNWQYVQVLICWKIVVLS